MAPLDAHHGKLFSNQIQEFTGEIRDNLLQSRAKSEWRKYRKEQEKQERTGK